VFFGWLRLENAYIKKSKLSLGFTLKFARIRLLCFTLLLSHLFCRQITTYSYYLFIYIANSWASGMHHSNSMRPNFNAPQRPDSAVARSPVSQVSRVSQSPGDFPFHICPPEKNRDVRQSAKICITIPSALCILNPRGSSMAPSMASSP